MNRILSALLFVSLLAGCGVSELEVDEHDGADQVTDADDSLSATSQSWTTIRRDLRKCASPYCGGYFVRDLNRATVTEKYVARLDLSATGLSDVDQAKVTGAGDFELVLRGKLGPIDTATNTRAFLVTEAYRGMPGVTALATDTFYQAGHRSPQITCITAPCNNEVATSLNHSSTKVYFTSYSVKGASKQWVDQNWLASRVEEHGAIVAAHFSNGQSYAGGPEKVLDASQVFIRLPEHVGPCMMLMEPHCDTGKVSVYTRTQDRCTLHTACVQPGMCPMFMPACEAGYTLMSFRSGKNACNSYACDPTFTVQ
ncbi:MAG: DUF6748 domain-containing protein [Myxococcaceae bacterium]